jgi:hypothetical protein
LALTGLFAPALVTDKSYRPAILTGSPHRLPDLRSRLIKKYNRD